MIPVKQSTRHDPDKGTWGDCRRACVASLLELPSEAVPHFAHGGGPAEAAQQAERAWLAEQGLGIITWPVPDNLPVILENLETINPDTFFILTGMANTGFPHAVVCCGGRIVHDPSGAGIVGPLPDGTYRLDYLTPFMQARNDGEYAVDLAPLKRHARVALLFSGGKDSLALVHLFRAHWHRLTVYHLDTGDLLPETREIVAAVEKMVPRFCRIETNVKQWISANGMPSDLVPSSCTPLGRMLDHGHAGGVAIVDKFACCYANRWLPLIQRLPADGVTLVIKGTRNADPGMGLLRHVPGEQISECSKVTEGAEHWTPIQNWPDEKVFAYLRSVGAPISRVYEASSQGPECATCTAFWNEGRGAYLAKHHPKLSAEYRKGLNAIAGDLKRALAHLATEWAAGRPAAPIVEEIKGPIAAPPP